MYDGLMKVRVAVTVHYLEPTEPLYWKDINIQGNTGACTYVITSRGGVYVC